MQNKENGRAIFYPIQPMHGSTAQYGWLMNGVPVFTAGKSSWYAAGAGS